MIPPPPTSTLFPYTTLFRSRLRFEVGDETGNEHSQSNDQHRNDDYGNIKPRPQIPGRPKTVARRGPQICVSRSQDLRRTRSPNVRAKCSTLNAQCGLVPGAYFGYQSSP